MMQQLLKSWPDEGPGSHIQGLFLTPNPLRGVRVTTGNLPDSFAMEGIHLLNPNNCRVADLFLLPILEQVIVDLA